MSDELDTILAESLRTRAAHADTHGRGFGEVRRRVRRHRQRQMAAGLLPAVAGFGWIVTRPVADDPLRPGADPSGCGDTVPASTWPDSTVSTMSDWTGGATSTTVAPPPWTGGTTTLPEAILLSTVPGEVVIVGDVTDNTAVTTTTGYYGSDGNPLGVDTTVEVDANGNVVESDVSSSTTIECDESSTLPSSTGPFDSGDSTTSTSTIATFEDNSFVLFVNASSVDGAASAYAAQFPGSQRTSGTSMVGTSYVLAVPAAEGAARSIAARLGISDVRIAYLDDPILGDYWVDSNDVQVAVVIGEGHALSLTSPTTTSIG